MKKKHHFKSIPLSKFIPNMVTLLALCSGLSSIRYALDGKWEWAVTCILLAALLDGMDGRLARLLGSTSKIGAELDSLADACNFGIAPGVIIYLFSLSHLKTAGWGVVLFYSICIVFRLARFNTFLGDEDQCLSALSKRFFVGLCAPLAALGALMPMIIFFEWGVRFPEWLYGGYVVVIALLSISKFPTFSFKSGGIPKKFVRIVFVFLGGIGVLLVTEPWLALFLIIFGYALSFPFSYSMYKKLRADL